MWKQNLVPEVILGPTQSGPGAEAEVDKRAVGGILLSTNSYTPQACSQCKISRTIRTL